MATTKISGTHRLVAQYLAFGHPLSAVCEVLKLDFERWRTISSSPLMKNEISRIQTEREIQLADQSLEDPLYAQLRLASKKAVDRLEVEVDNDDPETGANAGTRIKAATSILDRAGYLGGTKEQKNGVQVNIVISSGKAEALSALSPLEIAPESIIKEAI